jgi:hypothetical protein
MIAHPAVLSTRGVFIEGSELARQNQAPAAPPAICQQVDEIARNVALDGLVRPQSRPALREHTIREPEPLSHAGHGPDKRPSQMQPQLIIVCVLRLLSDIASKLHSVANALRGGLAHAALFSRQATLQGQIALPAAKRHVTFV